MGIAVDERHGEQSDECGQECCGNKGYGKRTLHENIADHVGLKIAYHAYKRFLTDKGQKSSKEQDQKFFKSFASLWAANMSSERIEFKREK